MRLEAIFVALYATVLLAVALGLHRLGRVNRSLRAGRFQDGRIGDGTDSATQDSDPGWPHSEVPRFYTSIAVVAAGASALLPAGELVVRHHRTVETAMLGMVIALAVLTVGWLGAKIQ